MSMTRIRHAVGTVAVLAASGLLVHAAGATSCAVMLEWNDVRYDGGGLDEETLFAGRVGEGTVPPCGEGEAGCWAAEAEEIDVYRLPGVDPRVAVGARGPFGREAYFATGYFPELPDHPLHDAAFGSPRRPRATAGWDCGPPLRGLVGDVVETPGWGRTFPVRFEDERVRRHQGRTDLFVGVETTIVGFRAHGLPRIEKGDRIRATVRACTASGERYKVVAELIAPAS